MKIASVDIQRFRSISAMTLADLGSFNVLIGKNNAGKSNVLTAISAFFASLTSGDVVDLRPTINSELDFFDGNTDEPIRITMHFRLSEAEMTALRNDVIATSPQLEEAAQSFSTDEQLAVTLCAVPPPGAFSYLERITLLRDGSHRDLLQISPDAARELRDRAASLRDRRGDLRSLRLMRDRVSADDWTGYRDVPAGFSPTRYWLRRYGEEPSPSLEAQLNEAWQRVDTYEALKAEMGVLATNVEEEAATIEAQELSSTVRGFGGEESQVPAYVHRLLSRADESRVLYLRERREPIGRSEAQQLLALKVRRGGLERLQTIQTTVASLLGVQLDAFESAGARRGPGAEAEMDVDNFLVQVNGAGIREALRIVLDVEFTGPGLLLVEEPEIHLHPALETSLMQYLKRISPDVQIIISTHSTNFLDVAEMRNVYLVSRPGSQTEVQLLSFGEAEEEIPRELGIRLSSLFMFDRLVFVEGPTDEAVLREWAATLRLNLSSSNVGFIAMGGARNFAFFAAEQTLAFLSRRRVGIWFVLDRDERDDDDVKRMTTLAGDEARVSVLQRRELENYLADPSALSRFIGLKRELAGLEVGEVTEAAVATDLSECAESLKEATIRRRLEKLLGKPAYLPRESDATNGADSTTVLRQALEEMQSGIEVRLGQLETTASETTTGLDEVWDRDKLALVPGDELLDCVAQRYGVRYRKDRGDGARIAALMSEGAIPTEIRELLKSIAT